MRRFDTSYFDEATVRLAVGGCCHDFAIALHRRTGWPLACVWRDPIEDRFSLFREPMVVHMVCVEPGGSMVDAEGTSSLPDLMARFASPEIGDRLRFKIVGTEREWEEVARDNDSARELLPREHRIAAAGIVIAGSAGFVALIERFADEATRGFVSGVP